MTRLAETANSPNPVFLPVRTHRRRPRRDLVGTAAGLVLLILVILAVAAPVIAQHDPLEMSLGETFQAPSATHPFGTDEFGRDLLSRVVFGARVSVGTAAMVVIIASALGIPLGLIAGYFSGVADAVLMRLIDTLLAFPAIVLAMSLIAVLGTGATNGMIAVIMVSIPSFARLVRASTLQQKAQEYVMAARAIGASDGRIIFSAILPNCLPAVLTQVAISASTAVLLEAGLSFLGLGVTPPTPSWGQMLNTARTFLYRSAWYGLFPGIFLTVFVLSLNILSDSLQKRISGGKIR
jgi:peptide/nickel transport system permease protein